MKINKSNAEIINSKEVSIHDDFLLSFNFDRNAKKLLLKFKKNYPIKKLYDMEFSNVIGFEMTACDFWGASICAFDFEYIDSNEQLLIPKLIDRFNQPGCHYTNAYEEYIETVITFTSGDSLRVACETISM